MNFVDDPTRKSREHSRQARYQYDLGTGADWTISLDKEPRALVHPPMLKIPDRTLEGPPTFAEESFSAIG